MKYRQWVITFWDMTQIRHYHNKWNFSIDGCRYNALQKKANGLYFGVQSIRIYFR